MTNFDRSITPADQRLIDALSVEGRASVTELAHLLGLSRTTVQTRMQRLQDSGVIAGYGVRLHPAIDAQRMGAQSLMRIDPKQSAQVNAAIGRISSVRELYSVAGEFDLLAVLRADTALELDAALDALSAIDGVERTQSCVLLCRKLQR